MTNKPRKFRCSSRTAPTRGRSLNRKHQNILIEHFAIYRIVKCRRNSPQKTIPLKELEGKIKKLSSLPSANAKTWRSIANSSGGWSRGLKGRGGRAPATRRRATGFEKMRISEDQLIRRENIRKSEYQDFTRLKNCRT